MTGHIFAVKRFEIHDGDGIRTTLFLQGCSLKCRWCHNPEGLRAHPLLGFYRDNCVNCRMCQAVCMAGVHTWQEGRHEIDRCKCIGCGKCVDICLQRALRLYGHDVEANEILPNLLEDRLFYGDKGGVTLSGGEPLLQKEFCLELLEKLKSAGVHTAVDTCGMVPKSTFEAVTPWVDQFLFDVKAADSRVHEKLTGSGNGQILENLRYLNAIGARIEVRIPLVPGCNDGEIEAIGSILKECSSVEKVRVLGYHNLALDKYRSLDMAYPMENAQPASKMQVEAAMELLRKMSIDAVC